MAEAAVLAASLLLSTVAVAWLVRDLGRHALDRESERLDAIERRELLRRVEEVEAAEVELRERVKGLELGRLGRRQ